MNAAQAERKPRLTPEQDLLAILMAFYPALARGQCKETILKRLPEFKSEDCDPEGVASALKSFRFVPDAFACYPEDLEIDFFEVEITSLMKPHKLQAYAKLVTDLDTYGIEVNLYTVNQHGHINRVPLLNHYIQWLTS